MSLNQYAGICFMCDKEVPPKNGDFQSLGSLPKSERSKYKSKWLVRCFECKGLGNFHTALSALTNPPAIKGERNN